MVSMKGVGYFSFLMFLKYPVDLAMFAGNLSHIFITF